MSETPETDAAWQAPVEDNEDHTIILVDLCGKLERERNGKQRQIEAHVSAVHELRKERDEARELAEQARAGSVDFIPFPWD